MAMTDSAVVHGTGRASRASARRPPANLQTSKSVYVWRGRTYKDGVTLPTLPWREITAPESASYGIWPKGLWRPPFGAVGYRA